LFRESGDEVQKFRSSEVQKFRSSDGRQKTERITQRTLRAQSSQRKRRKTRTLADLKIGHCGGNAIRENGVPRMAARGLAGARFIVPLQRLKIWVIRVSA
jgi:hypothetical protein